MNTATSTDVNDYEILIRRRGETGYASYCPQLARMVVGTAHEEVEEAMKDIVRKHVQDLKDRTEQAG